MLNVIPTTPPQATATTNLATTLRDDVIAISFILFTAAFWSMVKSRPVTSCNPAPSSSRTGYYSSQEGQAVR